MRSAIELLNMALELDPGFAEAHAHLARRYMFLFYLFLSDPKMKELSLVHARRAVELGPRVAVAWFAHGDALGTEGRWQESRQAYLKAIEIDPQYGPAMADLSLAEVELGRYDDGFYWACRGLQADTSSLSARFHVTVPLLMLDELELVSGYVRRFAPVDPSPRLPRSGYWAELLGGDVEPAIAGMRALCRQHPDNQELRLSLAEMAGFAALSEALELLEQPTIKLPHVPGDFLPHTYALLAAGALLRAGKAREADSLLDASHAEDTRELSSGDSPRIRVRLACIHAVRGDRAGAQRWLDEAYLSGWRGGRISSRDPMLASVRDTAEFQAWLERIEADVMRMRDRAKAGEVLTELG